MKCNDLGHFCSIFTDLKGVVSALHIMYLQKTDHFRIASPRGFKKSHRKGAAFNNGDTYVHSGLLVCMQDEPEGI
jgi:hypothetical protein